MKLYFIASTYRGDFLVDGVCHYHVAKLVGTHFQTPCRINTMLHSPDFSSEIEPSRKGWSLCPVCKKQWNRRTGEFKKFKQSRSASAE